MEFAYSRRQLLKNLPFAAAGAISPRALPGRPAFPGPFRPDWASLSEYRVPEWFRDAKLGVFLHWGVYAVPAHSSEWYSRLMYRRSNPVFAWHRRHWGAQSIFGYKDFIPMFRGERWRPQEWVALFQSMGARYLVPVGEHCDGFPMYDCAYTRWCAATMGPQRNVVGELARAARRQGLKLGVSQHRNWHWSWYTYAPDFDTDNRRYSGLYGRPHPPGRPIDNRPGEILQIAPRAFVQDWYARTIEIVNQFRPDLLWLEWGIQAAEYEPYRKQLAAYFYNRAAQRGQEVVLNYKDGAFPAHAAVLNIERRTELGIRALPWQCGTSISKKSWGYIEDDEYRSAADIIHELADVVSKNGNLLLNFGPQADGTIPAAARKIAAELEAWTRINGEAIFGTRPWKIFGEGPTHYAGGRHGDETTRPGPFTPRDIRFTCGQGRLYAILLAWPGRQAVIRSLGGSTPYAPSQIQQVTLMGHADRLVWRRTREALYIELPPHPPGQHAYALRIEAIMPFI